MFSYLRVFVVKRRDPDDALLDLLRVFVLPWLREATRPARSLRSALVILDADQPMRSYKTFLPLVLAIAVLLVAFRALHRGGRRRLLR